MASSKVGLLTVATLLVARAALVVLAEDPAPPESPAPATILDTDLLQEESYALAHPPHLSASRHQSQFRSDGAFPDPSLEEGQAFNAHQGQSFRLDPAAAIDSQQGAQDGRRPMLKNYEAGVQDPGFQREQAYRQETFDNLDVRRSESQRFSQDQAFSQGQQESQRFAQDQAFSQRLENQAYSQRQQENQVYSQRQQDNQAYSQRQDNQAYSQRQQESQRFAQDQAFSQGQDEDLRQAPEEPQYPEDFDQAPFQSQGPRTRYPEAPPSSTGVPGEVAAQGEGSQSFRGNLHDDTSRLEVDDSSESSSSGSGGSQRYTGDEELEADQKDKKMGNYEYSYDIQAADTGDMKYHQETRKEGKVVGEYRVREADGSMRIVKYTADKDNGFQATVEYVMDHDEPEFGLRERPITRGHGPRPSGPSGTFQSSVSSFGSRSRPGTRFQDSRARVSSQFQGFQSPSRPDGFSAPRPFLAASRGQGTQRFQQGSSRSPSRFPQDLNNFQQDTLRESVRLQQESPGLLKRPGGRPSNFQESGSQAISPKFRNQYNQAQRQEQTGQFQQRSFQNQNKNQLKVQSRDEYQESTRDSFQPQTRESIQTHKEEHFHSQNKNQFPIHGQAHIENSDRFQSQDRFQFDSENRGQYQTRGNQFHDENRQFQTQEKNQYQAEDGQTENQDQSQDIQFQAQNKRFQSRERNHFQVQDGSQFQVQDGHFQSQDRNQFQTQDDQFQTQDIRQFQTQDRRQFSAQDSQFPVQDRRQFQAQERRQYQRQDSQFQTQDRRPFRAQNRNQYQTEDRSQFQSSNRGQFSSQDRNLFPNQGRFQTQSRSQLSLQSSREFQTQNDNQYQIQNRDQFLSRSRDQSENRNNFQRENEHQFQGSQTGNQFQVQQSDEFDRQQAVAPVTQDEENFEGRKQFQSSSIVQTQNQNRIQSETHVNFDGTSLESDREQHDITERYGMGTEHQNVDGDGLYSEVEDAFQNQRYGMKDSLHLGPYSTQRNLASVNAEVPHRQGSPNYRYPQGGAPQTGSQRQRTSSGRYVLQEDVFDNSRPREFKGAPEDIDITHDGIYQVSERYSDQLSQRVKSQRHQYSTTQDELYQFQEQRERFPATSSRDRNRDFEDHLDPALAATSQFQGQDATQAFQSPVEDQFYGSRQQDTEAFTRPQVSVPFLPRQAFQTISEPHPQHQS